MREKYKYAGKTVKIKGKVGYFGHLFHVNELELSE